MQSGRKGAVEKHFCPKDCIYKGPDGVSRKAVSRNTAKQFSRQKKKYLTLKTCLLSLTEEKMIFSRNLAKTSIVSCKSHHPIMVCCIVSGFLAGKIFMSMVVAKLSSGVAFTLVYIYAAELFPTALRQLIFITFRIIRQLSLEGTILKRFVAVVIVVVLVLNLCCASFLRNTGTLPWVRQHPGLE